MRLSIRLLGTEVFHVEWSSDSPTLEPDDCSRDLSGGTLSAYPLESGPVDRYMGFTMGLGGDDE